MLILNYLKRLLSSTSKYKMSRGTGETARGTIIAMKGRTMIERETGKGEIRMRAESSTERVSTVLVMEEEISRSREEVILRIDIETEKGVKRETIRREEKGKKTDKRDPIKSRVISVIETSMRIQSKQRFRCNSNMRRKMQRVNSW